MVSPEFYKNSQTYDFFIKLLGYQAGIDRYLHSIPFSAAPRGRILDVGCGTGLLGLHFLERFPDLQLLATDLEPNFLKATLANARARKIAPDRIKVAISNISNPKRIDLLEGTRDGLTDESFSIICVGAVIGYADDTAQSLRDLVALLKPGGILINIEMNESHTGRYVSHRYHYHNIPLQQMKQIIESEGCQVKTAKLRLRHLPAKFTRTAILATKPI